MSTVESLTILMGHTNNLSIITVFLDLEKAFELASPEVILAFLVRTGIRGRFSSWLQDYPHLRRARVRFHGLKSVYRGFENRTPHGVILSPLLFNLLME